jgi:hypothetical protein
MITAPSPHRTAFMRVATNLALGTVPFALLSILYPGVPIRDAGPGLLSLTIAATLALLLIASTRETELGSPPVRFAATRRCLSCLLLGSSLIVVPWNFQGLPCLSWAVAMGFGSRWLLYGLESMDLRAADRGREALPCFATRLRRMITWITGAVIPLSVLVGCPALPLLLISFFLTLFAQWTAMGEVLYQQPQAGLMNPLQPRERDSSFR